LGLARIPRAQGAARSSATYRHFADLNLIKAIHPPRAPPGDDRRLGVLQPHQLADYNVAFVYQIVGGELALFIPFDGDHFAINLRGEDI